MDRRDMLRRSTVLGLSALLFPALSKENTVRDKSGSLKIIVAGAHPDDPETGCGGTAKLLVDAGHDVLFYYLTTGQAGISGVSHTKASEIRRAEAEQACKILGVRSVFGKQVDGDTEINRQRFAEVLAFIEEQKPQIVFTHWPIDTHPDHRVCSNLFYHAWLNSASPFTLYYYEVMTGHQTQNFNPEIFIDISKTVEEKHRACFIHKSQKIEEEYAKYHGLMEKFRGMECPSKYGEAFIRQHSKSFPFIKEQV